jgi:hypothetical protein
MFRPRRGHHRADIHAVRCQQDKCCGVTQTLTPKHFAMIPPARRNLLGVGGGDYRHLIIFLNMILTVTFTNFINEIEFTKTGLVI